MKAAVWHNREDIRIEDVEEPVAGPGEVKIKINACGICGSDLHEYRDGPFIIPAKPHPLTGQHKGPVTLGHEFSAQVVEAGPGAEKFSPGDRVTMNALIVCGQCHYCRQGAFNMCIKLGSTGFAANGGFARFAAVKEYSLYSLPDSVSDDAGAFVEPLAVAVRAVKRSRLQIGDTVAVVGAGPIGLLVLEVCLAAGADKVFVIEPMPARRALAKKLGAFDVYDPGEGDPGKAIAGYTANLRADVAFDCVGSQPSFDTAIKVTGRRGRICVAGLSLKPIQVPFIRLWGHEKEITFSSGYENEFPAAIALLADQRVQVEPMISSRIALDDFIEKGMLPLIESPAQYIKILVYP